MLAPFTFCASPPKSKALAKPPMLWKKKLKNRSLRKKNIYFAANAVRPLPDLWIELWFRDRTATPLPTLMELFLKSGVSKP